MLTTNKQIQVNAPNEQPVALTTPPATTGTEEKLKQLITEKLGLEETQLLPEASFTNDLGIDSLDVFELFIAIENSFQINITAEEAEKLTTPGKLTDYIKKQRHEQ